MSISFSVITATYNRGKTIFRAISSVKNQNYEFVESIVIDGCSRDDTLAQISGLLDSQDTLISEPDKGIYDALNKGLKFASGDVICFLHSDDFYFNENTLSCVAEVFKDESVDIVYGDACFFKENDPSRIIRNYKSDKLSVSNLAWGKMPAHPAIFCRKKVYDELGNFKTDFKIAADYEFLCRLTKTSGFNAKYLNQNLVMMQSGGASKIGIKNTLLLNREVYRAIRSNDIYTNYLMLFSKYASKILQFFFIR